MRLAGDGRLDDARPVAEAADRGHFGEEVADPGADIGSAGGGSREDLAARLHKKNEGVVAEAVLRQEAGKARLALGRVAAVEDGGRIREGGGGRRGGERRGVTGRGLHAVVLGEHSEEIRGRDDSQECDDQDGDGAFQHGLGMRVASGRGGGARGDGSLAGEALTPGAEAFEIDTQPSLGHGCPPHVHHFSALIPRDSLRRSPEPDSMNHW